MSPSTQVSSADMMSHPQETNLDDDDDENEHRDEENDYLPPPPEDFFNESLTGTLPRSPISPEVNLPAASTCTEEEPSSPSPLGVQTRCTPVASEEERREMRVGGGVTKTTINRKKKEVYSSRNSSCVSTDSTTSTCTADSGIGVRSEISPRASPINTADYYNSRENLVDEEDVPSSQRYEVDEGVYSPHGSKTNSRPDSLEFRAQSPSKMVDINTEKDGLIQSMRDKIHELSRQENDITEEIKTNEDLGKKVGLMVESKVNQSEYAKFELFIGELNKIITLLLSLTQRLHRFEVQLQNLDMCDEQDRARKEQLTEKIDKLKEQHEEACYLRDVNVKRGDNVAIMLSKYLSDEEFADFQYYVDMKSQLALMQSEISEKVKLGRERLNDLQFSSDCW